MRHRVDIFLEDVAQHGKSARHIAIQRAVTDGQFAFIPGRQRQPAVPIAADHHAGSADSSLQILIRQAGWLTQQVLGDYRLGFIGTMHPVNVDDLAIDLQIPSQGDRIVHAVLAAVATGHRQPMHPRRSKRLGGNVTGQSTVDATR